MPASSPGSWLIFADSGGVGESLQQILEAQGEKGILVSRGKAYERMDSSHVCIRADQPEDIRRLFESAMDLRSTGMPWNRTSVEPRCFPSRRRHGSRDGSGSNSRLRQCLAGGAGDGARAMARAASSMVGHSRSAGSGRGFSCRSMWLKRLCGGWVELSLRSILHFGEGWWTWNPSPRAKTLLISCGRKSPVPTVKISLLSGTGNGWWRDWLESVNPAVRETPLRWRSDGSYLITGGLGDLGLMVARWMVAQGARRLILMGRTKLPPRSSWNSLETGSQLARQIAAIRELEESGASVHLVSADVADEKQMSAFVEQFRAEGWPPIRGVVHAAGVLQDGLLLQLDAAAMNKVLRPKMVGGWLLHRLLREAPLDFFVVFSSAGSLMGQPGQGNYAAANAFLDALAHHRRAQGLPALSINWGAWAELGFAQTEGGKTPDQAPRAAGNQEHAAQARARSDGAAAARRRDAGRSASSELASVSRVLSGRH